MRAGALLVEHVVRVPQVGEERLARIGFGHRALLSGTIRSQGRAECVLVERPAAPVKGNPRGEPSNPPTTKDKGAARDPSLPLVASVTVL
jgi:hypothetical protein